MHLVRSLLYTGNSYWIAQRNDRQEVVALHWTNPRLCRVREVRFRGSCSAKYSTRSATIRCSACRVWPAIQLVVPARDVLHIKLDTRRNPLIGETWLSALAPELATDAAIKNAATTFSNNMSRPSGVLTTDLQIKQPDVEALRARWNEQAKGMNAGGVPILTHGLKFQPIAISNQDAQIIEQQKLTDTKIAAVFGVPIILLGIHQTVHAKELRSDHGGMAGLGAWLCHQPHRAGI